MSTRQKRPTVKDSRIVHANPWFRVRHETLEWPNGAAGEYNIIEADPFCVIIAERDGRLLTVRQYRYPADAVTVEFPMGGSDPGEDLAAAARREFEEECGYVARTLREIGRIHTAPGIVAKGGHVFLATDLAQGERRLDPSEEGLVAEWVTIDAWRRMIRDGIVRDSTTLAAWSLFLESVYDRRA